MNIPGIIRAAIDQVIGFPRHKKFRSVSAAENNGPGIFEAGDERGIPVGDKALAQAGSSFAA